MRSRPDLLVGVLGTHTEVGKTFVTSAWLRTLRARAVHVAARKPVQSYDVRDASTDAKTLAAATGESESMVCRPHRSYPLPLAPPMAADELHRERIGLAELIEEIDWPADTEVGAVETVGGVLSPMAHDGDSIDLLVQLRVDAVLLVADAGLGALNAIRLSMAQISMTQTTQFRTLVFLNRYDEHDPLHRMNRRWLEERYRIATAVGIGEIRFA